MVHNIKSSVKAQFNRFSNWNRLLRAMAYWYRYIGILRSRIRKEPRVVIKPIEQITSEELRQAERFICQTIQTDCWPEEVSQLQNQSGVLDTKSKLY